MRIEGVELSSNINKKIGKATVWSSITEVMARLVSPIVNIVLARLLLPEAFGVVATITMVISFAEVFTDAGFTAFDPPEWDLTIGSWIELPPIKKKNKS